MDEIEWWEFDTAAEMAAQVAGDIGFVIESAGAAHGGARVALPGADAPEALLKALARAKDISWSGVTIVPTDDAVPAQAAPKLEKLFAAKGATVLSLSEEGAPNEQDAGRQADVRLGKLHWPLDLVCLGVGADGHVAGIHAGPDLDRAVSGPKERRAIGVAGRGVTLTAAALASARTVMVAISGADTRRTVEQAIKDGPLSSLPIGRLLAAIDVPVDIFWSAE